MYVVVGSLLDRNKLISAISGSDDLRSAYVQRLLRLAVSTSDLQGWRKSQILYGTELTLRDQQKHPC